MILEYIQEQIAWQSIKVRNSDVSMNDCFSRTSTLHERCALRLGWVQEGHQQRNSEIWVCQLITVHHSKWLVSHRDLSFYLPMKNGVKILTALLPYFIYDFFKFTRYIMIKINIGSLFVFFDPEHKNVVLLNLQSCIQHTTLCWSISPGVNKNLWQLFQLQFNKNKNK